MSKNRKRTQTRTLAQMQHLQAARQANLKKRRLISLEAKIDLLKLEVKELMELNYPPVKFPHSTSKSIVLRVSKTNTPDGDPAIESFLDTLAVDIDLLFQKAQNLRKR